jgi:hypothetical protein
MNRAIQICITRGVAPLSTNWSMDGEQLERNLSHSLRDLDVVAQLLESSDEASGDL